VNEKSAMLHLQFQV